MIERVISAGFEVRIFEAEALISMLTGSGDLAGCGMNDFDDLLIEKYMDIDPLLYDDLDRIGIESPIFVEVDSDEFFLADGHHRLAWAVAERKPVPVVLIYWYTDIFGLDVLVREVEVDYDHKR